MNSFNINTMQLLDIIYLITSLTSLAASVPQVRQLFREKRSDELSVSTWAMWLVCQVTFLVYVTSKGETLMLITNSVWLLFYAVMLTMILYYRRKPAPPPPETELASE